MTSLQLPNDVSAVAPVQADFSSSDLVLIRAAKVILNQRRRSAVKHASGRSPFQGSWDASLMAIGYAHYDPAQAMQELRSLFKGQWRNGMIPHVVFHPGDGGDTGPFPSPDLWQSERSPYAPAGVATSGIVQPPIHATAAWHIYRYAPDRRAAFQFLVELFPQLVAWHHYLYRERALHTDGLIYIRHPWESGQDTSPLWDTILQGIPVLPEQLPADLDDSRQGSRVRYPDPSHYDRHLYLLLQARRCRYDEAAIRDECPFLVQDVLFNTLLVKANRDLAAIARLLHFDPSPFERWAEQTAIAMNETLWSPELGYYRNYDLVNRSHDSTCVATGLAPLYAQVPGLPQAHQMVQHLMSSAFYSPLVRTCGVPSCSRHEGSFQPYQCWRGPVLPDLNWILHHGLKAYRYTVEAEQLRQVSLILPKQGGLYDYFHPDTGRGLGTNNSPRTAAVVLDLLLGS